MSSSIFPLSLSTHLSLWPRSPYPSQDASFFPQSRNTTSAGSQPPDTLLTSANPLSSRAVIDYTFVSRGWTSYVAAFMSLVWLSWNQNLILQKPGVLGQLSPSSLLMDWLASALTGGSPRLFQHKALDLPFSFFAWYEIEHTAGLKDTHLWMCSSKIGGWAIWSLSILLSYSKIPCFCEQK